MQPAIVHLIGPPAAGKLTIARNLAEQATAAGHHTVVLDNHHTNNVIFAVLDTDGRTPLPEQVWTHVGQVREAMFAAIEELSPPSWSFVFTNVLVDDAALDHGYVDRLSALAEATGRRYRPVNLTCHPDQLVARAANPDRVARMKWVDPQGIAAFASEARMLRLTGPDALDLDSTTTPPVESARAILDHLLR